MSENPRREQRGRVLVLTIDRPAKRNALNYAAHRRSATPSAAPRGVVVVLAAQGPHFSSGLDLNELHDADAVEALQHSRRWHRLMDQVQFGAVPVVSALHGAVIGGGFEMAAATHIRVAERNAYFALPETVASTWAGRRCGSTSWAWRA